MAIPLKVLVAESNPVASAGITLELRSLPGVCAIGVAADAAQLEEMVSAASPDVVILDPRHLAPDPADLVRQLRAAAPTMQIVVLTAYVSDREHGELREAGARAVVLKEIDHRSLPRALFE